ncbi:hypothetical protein BDW75DRAFT_221788 [Aspergillus navahoensis]
MKLQICASASHPIFRHQIAFSIRASPSPILKTTSADKAFAVKSTINGQTNSTAKFYPMQTSGIVCMKPLESPNLRSTVINKAQLYWHLVMPVGLCSSPEIHLCFSWIEAEDVIREGPERTVVNSIDAAHMAVISMH